MSSKLPHAFVLRNRELFRNILSLKDALNRMPLVRLLGKFYIKDVDLAQQKQYKRIFPTSDPIDTIRSEVGKLPEAATIAEMMTKLRQLIKELVPGKYDLYFHNTSATNPRLFRESKLKPVDMGDANFDFDELLASIDFALRQQGATFPPDAPSPYDDIIKKYIKTHEDAYHQVIFTSPETDMSQFEQELPELPQQWGSAESASVPDFVEEYEPPAKRQNVEEPLGELSFIE